MQFWANVLDEALIVAIFAVSLNVILGYAGQLSIAPAGLGGVGAYTAGYLSAQHGWDFGPALAVGTFAALVVGTALGVPALRLGQDYLILLTLAFATVIAGALAAIPAFGGSYGLLGIKLVDIGQPLVQPTTYLRLTAPICAASCLFCWRLAASPFGRVLRGIREDENATEALGKNVVAYKILTFSLTSAVAGVGGVMMVYYDQIASPNQFDFSATTLMIAAAIVGGMGNLAGSFVGAVVLTSIGPLLEKVVNVNPDTASLWQLLIYGALLVVVMRLRPAGLIPEGTSFRHRLRTSSVPRFHTAERKEQDKATVSILRPAAGAAAPDDGPVLVARGLTKHFGGIRAVEKLDLELLPGRVTALVGPNGAGKTTVFNLLTGRIKVDAGTVLLRGHDITNLSPHRTASLGLVRSFQDVRLLSRLTLLDNVRLGVPDQPGERLHNLFMRPQRVRAGEREATARALECLEFVGLKHRALERAGSLGFGDQKLLAISRILATGGDILLVDEPASGIDRGSMTPVFEVIERLREAGKTICLVEHNLEVVSHLADHVLFMEQGRITAEGTMAEITGIDRLADVYFGRG